VIPVVYTYLSGPVNVEAHAGGGVAPAGKPGEAVAPAE
jgi:hypothetical protein